MNEGAKQKKTIYDRIKKKDLISTQDWDKDDLEEILNLTKDIKENPAKYFDVLKGKSLCLFFFNPSTRTRNSIEVGIAQLGGYAVYNDPQYSWWGQSSESIQDTAIVLSRYHACIAIRQFPNRIGWIWGESNRQLREFAKHSERPVINLEDDMYHPLQEFADIFTIREKLKDERKKKIVIQWVYHPKPLPMSVPNSITLITTRFGMDVTLLCPPGYELHEDIMNQAKKNAVENGGTFQVCHDIQKGYEDADVVYVKSWSSLKHYGDPKEEKKMRMPYRGPWICNEEYMKLTKSDSIFMHCLPVRRNIEVTDSVMDGPHSVVYDEAENRLYTAKAVLCFLMRNPFGSRATFY
jgi:N-acetylornithine carbamoyltransferase